MMLTSTMKAFIFSSALLAVAMADTCSDCTAVVSTIQARLMSEESLAAQGVVILSSKKTKIPSDQTPVICRLSWLVESAQAQRTWPHARQAFLDSGIKSQLFYGLATGTPL